MKKTMYLVIALLLMASCLFAQQGEYSRKSVSSLGGVWFGPNARSYDFDQDFFTLLLNTYIQDARFDFNELSIASQRDFWQLSSRLGEMNVKQLSEILQQTVGKDIVKILSDPQIQAARRATLQSESDWLRLAQIKGNEYGLTEEQLGILMNSAYLYLPYVEQITRSQDGNSLSYAIKGGILWYQVLISPEGKVSMELMESASDSGTGFASLGNKAYESYRLGSVRYPTSASQYAQYEGMQTWVKNLGVIMKRIPDFSLSAQIIEKLSGSRYSSNLGKREGVHLDDGFFISELYEDAGGKIKKKRLGYGRLIKNADNRSNPEQLSEIKLFYGNRIMPGAILEENPRLGLEVAFSAGIISDMSIPQTVFHSMGVNKDVESGFGMNLDLSFNLAPIWGVTQTYWDLQLGLGFPAVTDDTHDTSSTIASIYTGLDKKMWLGRNALGIGASVGYDAFNSKVTIGITEYDSNISTLGAKLTAKYIFLVSPNFQLTAAASKKFSSATILASYKANNLSFDYSESALEGLNLGGTSLEIGFNWLLRSFPYNIFGWLDPLKKY